MDEAPDAAVLLEGARHGAPGASEVLLALLCQDLRRIAGCVFGRRGGGGAG